MKKLLLIVFGAFILSTSMSAQVLVPLSVNYDDEQPLGNDYPRTPITVPNVYIDDYTLLFEASHPEYVLYIKDEDDNVVYSTVVYSTQTHVVLPSTLSGTYELQLYDGGDYYFYSKIEL